MVAAQTTEFELKPEMIESLCYNCARGQTWVSIKLDAPNTAQLADLTESMAGERLNVVLGAQVLVSIIVPGRIDSGGIAPKVHTVEEAKALIRGLRPGIAEQGIVHCTPWEDECGKPYVEPEEANFTLTPELVQEACYAQTFGVYAVSIRLTPKAANDFEELIANRIGQRLSVEFEGETVSRPVIQGRIEGGRMSLTGIPTLEEAKNLVRRLRPGIVEENIQDCAVLARQKSQEPKFFKLFVELHMLERFCLTNTPGGYGVNLQLTEPNRTWFAKTTEDLVGHGLEVMYNGESIAKPRVHEGIESGLIPLGEFPQLDEAKDFVRKLQPGTMGEDVGSCD